MNKLSARAQSIILVLISVALFALLSLIAKLLGGERFGPGLHPLQISAARFIVAFLAITVSLAFLPINFKNVPWELHIKRGISGWCGVTCLFAAAIAIPLANANAVSFLSVIVAMALAVPLLGEKVGPKRWSAALLAFLGVLVIIRPGTSAFHPMALVALMAALFIGFEIIFIKQLSGREPTLRILFINNLIGAVISMLVLTFVWIQPTWQQWIGLSLIGVLMIGVQVTNVMALRLGDASFIAPFWYATPIFAAIYDYLVFRHVISGWSSLGILMIVTGGLIIAYRENASKSEKTQ